MAEINEVIERVKTRVEASRIFLGHPSIEDQDALTLLAEFAIYQSAMKHIANQLSTFDAGDYEPLGALGEAILAVDELAEYALYRTPASAQTAARLNTPTTPAPQAWTPEIGSEVRITEAANHSGLGQYVGRYGVVVEFRTTLSGVQYVVTFHGFISQHMFALPELEPVD